MALYDTFAQVGKKEDITDVISNISPTKTPFQTSIGGIKVWNTLFQWQEDSLATANGANYQIEGFTAVDATLIPTVMRSNYTQIFQKTIKVSNTADAVSTYGRAKEAAYQMAKAAAEVKRDLEMTLVGNATQTAVAGASGVTARQMAGVTAQIAAGALTKTGATSNPITEALLLTNLQACYTNGAEPNTIMVTPADSLVIAGFAAATGRLRDLTDLSDNAQKIVNAVTVYVSPFGEQKVVLNRFLYQYETIIYDPMMWKLATLRPWTRETLAKTGDNLMMMIVGEFSLQHKNYLATGRIQKSA
jgi:Family of unknown function (DUF5309)